VKKKILFIIYSLEIGGSEQLVFDIVKNLPLNKYEPYICTLTKIGVLGEDLERRGFKVYCLNRRGKFDLLAFFKLIKLIKNLKINIIHTHRFTANLWGRVAGLIVGTKVIISTEHGIDSYKGKVRIFLDRLLAKYTSTLIAVSNDIKDFLTTKHKIPNAKIKVIENGVDIERILRIDSDKLLQNDRISKLFKDNLIKIGIIGRLEPVKGHKYFLEAAKKWIFHNHNARFFIIGNGSLYHEINDFIKDRGLVNDIILTGARSDIPAILRKLDILVISSISEGLPITLLEAMAAKKAIIATKVGAIPDVLTNGLNGILVEPENAEQIYNAINKLLNHPHLIHTLGENAYRRIRERFDILNTIKQYEEVYFAN